MKPSQTPPTPAKTCKLWQRTPFANLIRYVPSGTYFARLRVAGKLKKRGLKTRVLSVAKLRLSDFERSERSKAENTQAVGGGKVTMADAAAIHRRRVAGDADLKPRTVDYHGQRLKALFKSWPGLDTTQVRDLTKTDCLNWAASYRVKAASVTYNHAVGILRTLLEIGIEHGARYDNPAKAINRATEKPKELTLPEPAQFEAFIHEIERGGSGKSQPCARLVRFMAYGGFRKTEAANVTWSDCDFDKGEILVRGDPLTGTKSGFVRRVPMIPDIRKLLEGIQTERPAFKTDEPVMRVRECQKAMDRAARKVGMKRITHHDLRHLFATRCIESGVDIATVSRWLGHRDGGALAMKVYGHLREEHSQAMAAKVTFGPAPAPDVVVQLPGMQAILRRS